MKISDDIIARLPTMDGDFYYLNLGPVVKLWVKRNDKKLFQSKFVYKGEIMSTECGSLDQIHTHLGNYFWTKNGFVKEEEAVF